MEISPISKNISKRGKSIKGILKVELTNYDIFVYEGTISQFDIIVQYKKIGLRKERTPKHIHWVVDLLLKNQGKKKIANKFLTCIQEYWNNCEPLVNNDYQTLHDIIVNDYNSINTKKYKKLNKYGEYDVEFLSVLFILLIHQEKTNYNQAYMFKSIIDNLLKEKLDIYSIVGIATHGGN